MQKFLRVAERKLSKAVIRIVLVLLPVMGFAQVEPGCSLFGYYDSHGVLVQSPMLNAPLVDGTRVSDEFGWRYHPVFHKWRMHYGTDCATPFGSPIHVVADGTVVEAGFKGASGLYVRVRHDSTFETAYAHGSRLAAGIRPGMHVRRGQVIMYAGSSGLTDGGCNLHFEIYLHGKRVAPAVRCERPVMLVPIQTRPALPHRRSRKVKPSTRIAQRRGFNQ